ncbi:hypothetical protein SAMN04489761_4085, partial [Tenacibaculum sp. MAR_2009_124]
SVSVTSGELPPSSGSTESTIPSPSLSVVLSILPSLSISKLGSEPLSTKSEIPSLSLSNLGNLDYHRHRILLDQCFRLQLHHYHIISCIYNTPSLSASTVLSSTPSPSHQVSLHLGHSLLDPKYHRHHYLNLNDLEYHRHRYLYLDRTACSTLSKIPSLSESKII